MGVQHYFEHATYDRNLVSDSLSLYVKRLNTIFASASGENIAAGNSTAEEPIGSGIMAQVIIVICSIQNGIE